jgi:transcription elongation factor B polypeptide 3
MVESQESLLKAVRHYQQSLDKYTEHRNDSKLLYYLNKLYHLPVKVFHLEETGVGRTVNNLRKLGGEVGHSAKDLVSKWKDMVVGEQEQEQENEEDDEDEDEEDGYQSGDDPSNDSDDKDSRDERMKVNTSSSHRKSDRRSDDKERGKHRSSSKSESSHRSDSSRSGKRDKHNGHEKGHKRRTDDSTSEDEVPKKRPKKSESDDRAKSSRKLNSDSEEESRPKEKKHKSDKHKTEHKAKKMRDSSSDAEEAQKSNKTKEKSRESKDKHRSSKKDDSKKHEHERKTKEKDKRNKEERKVREKSEDKKAKSSKTKLPTEVLPNNGIDSGSGASFAEALGMCEPSSSKNSAKKKPSVEKKEKPAKLEDSVPKLLKEVSLEPPTDLNLSSLLPAITPNYRPLGNLLNSDSQPKKSLSEYEALSNIMTSKNQRTKVYSGNKMGTSKVPTLFELCSRVLQDNIDALEYTGGVPYSVLKPILEKSNPNQLYMMEHHNPYLIEDTDELWKVHCQKEFRNKKREELETWREMYLRCLDEREAKLKALTANIKQSQDKSIPVRMTKLAYVDAVAKPPRNIARKQAKNGTAFDKMPSAKLSSLATAGDAGKVAVPNPGSRAAERSTSHAVKPKKAPLMLKSISSFKNRFKR